MRPAALVFATLFVACGSPPPPAPPVESPAAASNSASVPASPPIASTTTAVAAAPSASVDPAPPLPPRGEPEITKGRIVVPESKCSGRSLSLDAIERDCACEPRAKIDAQRGTVCPGQTESQSTEIHDLAVVIEASAPQVKSGAKAGSTVRFENKSESALPVSFLRDRQLELVFLNEDGSAVPAEGKDTCPAMLSLAKLAGVTLGPGGAVSAEVSLSARKRKHRAGKDACGTVDGTPLPMGKYQVGLAESPLYGKARVKNARVEVVAR